jgi:hypothetical protein
MLGERVKTEADGAEFEVKQYTATYGKGSIDTKGRLSIPLTYTAELARVINPVEVRSKIQGRAEEELRTLIFSLPGLESAKISLWPFWVRRVPTNPDKIRIAVD